MKKFIFNMIVLAAVLLVTASGVRASENDAVTLKVSLPDLNTSAEHVGIAVYQVAEPEIPGKTDKFVWIPSLNDIGITPEELDTKPQRDPELFAALSAYAQLFPESKWLTPQQRTWLADKDNIL